MGIKIKNLQTGEFEKFNIPALKGEKGEPGEIEPSEKVDYIGKQHSKLRDTMNANVDYIIKTAIGEFNYLDYEGQHITATNSIEGHAKSAILKGQTLVNLARPSVRTYTITRTESDSRQIWYVPYAYRISVGKTYYVQFKISNVTGDTTGNIIFSSCNGQQGEVELQVKNQTVSFKITPTIDRGAQLEKCGIYFLANGTQTSAEISDLVFVEYQQGMENWDIPYFEGMQSVKMPVLTATGKNLFDEELFFSLQDIGFVKTNKGFTTNKYFLDSKFYPLKLKPNTTYSLSKLADNQGGTLIQIKIGDIRYTTDNSGNLPTSSSFTTDNTGIVYIRGGASGYGNVGLYTIEHMWIVEGTVKGIYEPYKSNILSTPEEVVLRGFDSVKDTLNLNTGEYVKRIGELTLDGSEYWQYAGNTDGTIRFNLPISDFKNYNTSSDGKNLINDKLPKAYFSIAGNTYGVTTWCNHVVFFTEHTNVNDFKQWLSQNPTTIQYELETPIIKTVNLSDNHVYSYKGTTHYDCSSAEGSLVPTLSVKVPTDTQLTIQEQKATTQTLLIKNMDLQQSIKEVQAMNLAFNTALYNSFNSIREEVEDIKKHVSTNENLEGSF